MKKKRLSACALLFLACLFIGCGSDKDLEPEADLLAKGADPPTLQVDANPPQTRLTYFLFQIKLGDPNLSPVGKDKWTVDDCDIRYSLISDPGGHLQALPATVSGRKIAQVIPPGIVGRVAVTLVEDSYLMANAQGFTGTSDRATVRAHLVFRCHRNADGTRKVLTQRFTFDIGDF